MKHLLVLLSACALLAGAAPARAANRVASVALIWRVPAPHSADPGVQAVEAGMVAIGALNAQLGALATHPQSRATLAFDPQYLAALQRLALGNSSLLDLAANRLSATDARASDLLDPLSQGVAMNQTLANTAAGKRFTAHAAAARLVLNGVSAARFSTHDVLDFAGSGVLLGLAASGLSRETAPLLNKNNLDARDVRAINAVFARAARAVLAQAKALAASGSVEIAALPAYEPIVPLIVDAAGRTRQEANTVNVGGRTDAVAAVDDGMLAATALAGAANPGIISPHGAYDDEAGAVLQERHPAYAVFSDRVAKAATGASAEAVNASKAAALHSYLLETSKTAKLPILFCSDTLSSAIDFLPAATAPAALGDRIRDTARDALALSSPNDATILTLCLDLDSPLLQRADRGAMLAHLDAVLSGTGGLEATTPRQFLRRHPATADTYGFEPATDAGGFALWMGSGNQASLWTALSDARSSAGGDAAVTHPAIRAALLRAESNRWFMALSLPQPRAATERLLAQFRSAIAQVYRAANVPVPAEIAPVKWDHPASIATPPPARV